MPVSDEDFKALKDQVAALVAASASNSSGFHLPSLSKDNLDRLAKILFAAAVTAVLAWINDKTGDIKNTQEVNKQEIKKDIGDVKKDAEAAKAEAEQVKMITAAHKDKVETTLNNLDKKADALKSAVDKK